MADDRVSRRGFLRFRFGGTAPRMRWLANDDKPTAAPAADARAHAMVAKVMMFQGLAGGNSTCTTCFEQCPPKAISMDQERPVVNVGACDGCGICRDVCPAPAKGILLLPKIV